MTALHQFGAEMLKLSRGLDSFPITEVSSPCHDKHDVNMEESRCEAHKTDMLEINITESEALEEHQRESVSRKK